MSVLPSLLAFGLAATLLTITPGLDTAMVLRSAVAGGPRQAIATAIGIGLGCLAWGAAVALGLGIVLTASTLAYTVLKWAGAAYLLWLGINLLFRPRSRMTAETASLVVPLSRSAAMRRGFLTNLLNPKIGVFYVATIPQFIPDGVSHLGMGLLLAGVHDVLGLTWLTGIIIAAHAARRWLAHERARRIIDRIAGTVLIGFSARLALERH